MRQSLGSIPFRLWRALFGYDIFISYSSSDAPYAASLEKRLKQSGFRVFRDQSGSEAGDRLETLLRAVRRSRMLVVVVTPASLDSRWVHDEIQAFLEAPGPRRLVGLFFDQGYPRILPEKFAALKMYRGIRASPDDLRGPAVSDDVAAEIQRTFRAVRMQVFRLVTAGLLLLIAGSIYFIQSRSQARAEERDRWLRRAGTAQAELRMDVAELAVARAAAADPDSASELLDDYRQSRVSRQLVPRSQTAVPRSYVLLHLGSNGNEPYAVYQDQEGGALWLDSGDQRTHIAGKCGPSPNPVSRSRDLIFACGNALYSLDVTKPSSPRRAAVTSEPVAITLVDNELRTLERARQELPVIKAWDPQTLEFLWSKELSGAPAAGVAGLCASPMRLAWTVNIEARHIAVRLWAREDASPDIERVPLPDSAASEILPPWMDSAIASPGCERFFVAQNPASAPGAKTEGEFVRIRLGPSRQVNHFDKSARQLVATNEETGYEALYATASRELRAFVLTSPIVLDTRVRTLAPGVLAFASWPVASSRSGLNVLAADDTWLTVFRDAKPQARYPSLVKHPTRILVSETGRFAAIQGEDAISTWEAADPWTGDRVPAVDALSRELNLYWLKRGDPEYKVPRR